MAACYQKKQLIDISNDSGLKNNSMVVVCSMRSEFPELSEEALKIIMQLSTIFLREKGFSSLVQMKKYTCRFSIEFDLKLSQISRNSARGSKLNHLINSN